MPARLRKMLEALTLALVVVLVAACAGPAPAGISPAAAGTALAARTLPVATAASEKNATGAAVRADATQAPTAQQVATSAAQAPATAQPAPTTAAATSGPAPQVGALAPDFALADLDGTPRSLADYRGKVVMLNFFASWCGHCRSEIPALVAVYADYKDQGFEIVAVSMGEDPVGLKAFVQENGMAFTVLADSLTATMAPYQLRSVPTTYFLDAQGVIQEVYGGAIDEEVLRDKVKGLLGQ